MFKSLITASFFKPMLIAFASLSLSCVCLAKTPHDFFDYAQQNAPVNSLVYIQSSLSKQQIELNVDSALSNESIDLESTHDLAKFYVQVLLDMKGYVDNQSVDKMMKDYGFGKQLDFAFYLDGITPVMHLSVSQADNFSKKIQLILNTYDISMNAKVINGKKLLTADMSTNGLELMNVIYVNDLVATIAVIPKNFTDTQISDVMGITRGEKSLFTTGSLNNIESTYGHKNATSGFINIVQTVNTVFGNNDAINSEYLMELDKRIEKNLSQVCQNEILGMLENTPSLTFGYKNTGNQNNHVAVDFLSTFNLENKMLKKELMSLSGHLMPSNTESGISISTGLNINNLLTTLTAWQQRAKTTEYECKQLSDLMSVIADENNLQWAAMLSTVQSIKGLHLSIYDLDLSTMLAGTFTMDMLVSVTSDYPQLLLLLTKAIPFLSDINIPSDGTSTVLDTPLLFDPVLKGSIQGKHIAIFTGEKSEQYASTLANIPINKNGIVNMFFDYAAFTDMYLKNIEFFATSSSKKQQQCITEYQSLLTYKNMGLKVNYELSVNPFGMDNKIDGSYNPNVQNDVLKTGTLDVMVLNAQCIWEKIGNETFNKDNTGGYSINDSNNQCALTKVDYTWQVNDNAIEIIESNNQTRDSCDQKFVEMEKSQYECQLIESTNSGFICYIQKDNAVELYRYQ